jgi:hypothetical protein
LASVDSNLIPGNLEDLAITSVGYRTPAAEEPIMSFTPEQIAWLQKTKEMAGGRDYQGLVAAPPWESEAAKKIPKGRYKDIPNNTWAGLPEVLYPATPDDWMALTAITLKVHEMDRVQFDVNTVMNENAGGPRLPHKVEWASMFAKQQTNMPTLKDLEKEYNRLKTEILSEIAAIHQPVLKDFLSKKIYKVIPPLFETMALRRTDSPPPPPPIGDEDKLIRFLLTDSPMP